MKHKDDFAVFILTHGRADNVFSYKSLRKHGYTGRIVLVIDDEDEQAKKYKELYGNEVYQFSKRKYEANSDCGINTYNRSCILMARNACWDIAEELNIRFFCEMDDDYACFGWRIPDVANRKLSHISVHCMDSILDCLIDYLDNAKQLTSVAIAQGGDLIGGVNSTLVKKGWKRKAMNSFICDTKRKFSFRGVLNDDVNTYTTTQNQGNVFLTYARVFLNQLATQSLEGGMSEFYDNCGTYQKSFMTVMMCPSAVKVSVMGDKYQRIHHRVNYKKCCAKIINEKYKKK